MDPLILLVIAIIAVAIVAWAIRRRRAEADPPEDALERAAMQAEKDRIRTEAIYRADRYDIRE